MRHGDHDAARCVELGCGTPGRGGAVWLAPPGTSPDDRAAWTFLGYVGHAEPGAEPFGRPVLPSLGGYQPGPPAHVHDRDLPCNVKCPAWPRCRACGRAAGMPTAPCHDCPDATQPGDRQDAPAPGRHIGQQEPASQRRSGVPRLATPDDAVRVHQLTITQAEGLAARIVSVLYRAAESVPMPEDTRTALHDAIARELGAEAGRDPG